MKRNAIILAAGKSNRFAPFTYEKPKGLFKIKGEILIERQIRQLQDAGIKDIYIVVGYMKEKFFYLEKKFGVHLLINNSFGTKGNIYSLYTARKYLDNTFLCCSDHYFVDNPFFDDNINNVSYRACSFLAGKFREFAVISSDMDVITDLQVGGQDSWAMVGHAYLNHSFCKGLKEFLEKEIDDFGVASMFWEEFYAKHMKELTFYIKKYHRSQILEFETIDDLRKFDSDFLTNVDSQIVVNISNSLQCMPNEIVDINVINAGLTNVSFSFCVRDSQYVYRHPGGTAGNLIDRKTELYAQKKAKEIGIDQSYIKMDQSGWKISDYVKEAKNCNLLYNDYQLEKGMGYLRKLHAIVPDSEIKVFDNVREGKRLIKIASATKGHLENEFSDILIKVERLYDLLKKDAKRLGYQKVLCHNDTYDPNFLCDKDGQIYLIDWEYAGLNYAANDIGSILCRADYSSEQIEKVLKVYLGHEPSREEKRFYYAFIPISGFYWFSWGLYKGSVGDDDSFFFLTSYRNIVRFIDAALESYEYEEGL